MSVVAHLRAWRPVLIAAGALIVAGLVAIPLGGWDTVRLQSAIVPERAIGEPHPGARVSTAIDDVYLTDAHPNGYTEPEPGETFLVVVATMENMTSDPQNPLGSRGFYAFTIPGLIDLRDSISASDQWSYLVRDDSNGPVLSPGVPDTVRLVFAVPDDLFAVGEEIAIGLTDATPQEADLYEGTRWHRPHVAAEVRIVLREER